MRARAVPPVLPALGGLALLLGMRLLGRAPGRALLGQTVVGCVRRTYGYGPPCRSGTPLVLGLVCRSGGLWRHVARGAHAAQDGAAQRRHVDDHRVGTTVAVLRPAGDDAGIELSGAAKLGGIGVEDLLVVALDGNCHTPAGLEVHVEVDDDDELLVWALALADERDDGVLGVIGAEPLEAAPLVGVAPEGGLGQVEVVERLAVVLVLAVRLELVGEEPLD